MKKNVIFGLAAMAALGLGGCGKQEINLLSEQIVVELGSNLDMNVTNYVELDEKEAAETKIDFSAVDVMKTGTYTAAVTYGEQTVSFEVLVKDTTAPVVEVREDIAVTAGETLFAEDIITNVTELSGEVTVAFQEAEAASAETEVVDGTEMIDATEQGEDIFPETGSFIVGDVTCSNAEIIYPETGEYDTVLTVADASGNSTEVPVHIVVGESPVFNGIEDITVSVGTEEVNYLDGISAVDCNENDITGQIVCDSSAVDLSTAGTYEIVYTVMDENGFKGTAKANVSVTEGKSDNTKKGTTNKANDNKKDSASKTNDNKNAEVSSTSNAGGNSGSTENKSNSNNGNNPSSSGGNSSNSGNGINGGSTPTPAPDKGGNSSNNGNSNGGSTPTPAPAPTPTPAPTPAPDNGNNGGGNISDENQQMQDQINDMINNGELTPFDPSTNPDRPDELGGIDW